MIYIRHKETGEILTANTGGEGFINHKSNSLLLGFDGIVYHVVAGDGGLYWDDMSYEYEYVTPGELQKIKKNKWEYLRKFIEAELKDAQYNYDGVLERQLEIILNFMEGIDNINAE